MPPILSGKVLVTGAAGFIGSHLVQRLLSRGYEVLGLDDLSTGRRENLPPGGTAGFSFVEGDCCDERLMQKLCVGLSAVLHQAARNSVLRSLEHPREALTVNLFGFLNLLEAARDAGVQRFVYASSSSVYGFPCQTPCREDAQTRPRSPYAISKLAAEDLARTFFAEYGFETIGLRYFNVFGPRQSTGGEYAAVVPRFITACLRKEAPLIYGDGSAARDFTFVDNVVDANLLALQAPQTCAGRIFNIGTGVAHSVNTLLSYIADQLGAMPEPVFGAARRGDLRSSLADLSLATTELGYSPRIDLRSGLAPTIAWYQENREVWLGR